MLLTVAGSPSLASDLTYADLADPADLAADLPLFIDVVTAAEQAAPTTPTMTQLDAAPAVADSPGATDVASLETQPPSAAMMFNMATPSETGDSDDGCGSDSGSSSGSDSGDGSGTGGDDDSGDDGDDDSGDDGDGDDDGSSDDDSFAFANHLHVGHSYGADSPNGGSGTLDLHVTVNPATATLLVDEADSNSYDDQVPLTGPTVSGTFTDSGQDSETYHESLTVNADGTYTDAGSDGGQSSDAYDLIESGTTADGSSFSDVDFGGDNMTCSDSGATSSDGTGTETYEEDDEASERAALTDSGPNGNVAAISDETITCDDNGTQSSDTFSTTDVGDDLSKVVATDPTNGYFTATDLKSDKYDDTNTASDVAAAPPTDTQDDAGSDAELTTIAVAGVPDAGGTDAEAATASRTDLYQDTATVAPDPTGFEDTTVEEDDTRTISSSESGSTPAGSFAGWSDNTETIDDEWEDEAIGQVDLKDDLTSSPPDGTYSGVSPTVPLMTAVTGAFAAAYDTLPEAAASVTAAISTLNPPSDTDDGSNDGDDDGIDADDNGGDDGSDGDDDGSHGDDGDSPGAGTTGAGQSPGTGTGTAPGTGPATPPQDPPPGTVNNRADLDAALAELMANPKFMSSYKKLYNKDGSPRKGWSDQYTGNLDAPPPLDNENPVANPLGSTAPNGTVTIFLNSTEFTRLRATQQNATYKKMLKNAIIHETIHVFIQTHDQHVDRFVTIDGKDFHVGDNPSQANNKPKQFGVRRNWGALFDYMQKNFPTRDKDLLNYRNSYLMPQKLYLDIDTRAQELISAILAP